MPSANCFDAPTLKDYLLGKLSDEQSDVVAAHLEACLSCEATVSQLDRASDTLTNGLRLPAVAADPQTDDELQKALNKVQSLEALAEHSTSEVSADRSPVLRDYRLLEPLGSGGMGQVFKAVHTRLDRLVAVKLLPARRLGDDQAVARFQREMRVIGQLSHPAIVQATDAGEVDGTHFLVMEYVEGCDLNTLAKVCGPLSVADACEITRQAAVGLEYAHQQGIVHRDIKPSNLMLSRPPNVSLKILDLGLALLSGVQAPVDELTTVGQLMGTLDYMAPEQLEDSHLVGPRADIYALAATLYRLLTGFAPFANENRKTPLQKLRALATQAAPPIRERRADLPLDLAAIIDRALSRDPAERFVSMNEFATALAPWCVGYDLSQLVGHVSNVPGPMVELPSLRHQPRSHVRQNVGESPNGPRSGERVYAMKDAPNARSGHVENVPHVSPPRRTLLIALALLFLAALGIVITIETNKGTLIVESLRDGIEVRVKKSGKTVEQLELTTGPKSARLAAGEYEIEILGDADGLQIQNGKFVLKRGDTVVAKVTEMPKGQAAVEMTEAEKVKLPVEPQLRKPVEIVDRTAKGMETFEASNPDLAAEKKVRDVLLKNTSVAFEDNPLTDVLTFLEDRTQIAFLLETQALTDEGIASDTPITLSLADKPTTTILEFLLRPIQLAWYIDGGQVVVTTAAKANEVMVTRMYPVGRLLPGVRQAVDRLKSEPLPPLPGARPDGGGGFFQVSSTAPLVGTLPLIFGQFGGSTIASAANAVDYKNGVIPTEASHFRELLSESLGHVWMEVNGEDGTCELLHNVLVVRNTRPAQADVESLLRTIEAAFLKPLTEPVEIRPAGYSLEADAIARRQLARKLDVKFTEAPLTDVATWLSDQLEVPVWLDRQALTEEGIPTDTPVTLQFQGIPGDVLLSRLLKPVQLAYVIEHGLLVLTTAAKMKERLVTKVYDVRDLLARGLHPERLFAGLESTTSGPWYVKDGEGGTITLFADTLLVIRQTSHSHDEVAKFLTSLRSQLSDQPEVPRVIKTRPKTPLAAQPNQPTPNEPKPTTPAPAKPTADNQPRYDGKSFDEWLAILDTERSPARLADAIEALRLLGRDTHAAQIAERVLKLARVLDFVPLGGNNNRPSIHTETIKLFAGLPDQVAQRAYANELRNGTTRSRVFVLQHMTSWQMLVSDEYVQAVLATCRDSDPQVRELSVTLLERLPLDGGLVRYAESRTQQFRIALTSAESRSVLRAAKHLLDSEPDFKAVASALARIAAKPGSPDQRMEALNMIAVMGPRAASVASQVAEVLLEQSDGGDVRPTYDIQLAKNQPFFWLAPFRTELNRNWQLVAAVALARMGKEAAAELPKIDEALGVLSETYKDRDDVSLSERVQLPELLIAVKSRIELQPPFDLRNGTLSAVEGALQVLAWNHKLLQMEQALLQQYRDENHPSVKELANRAATLSRAFALLAPHRDIHRTFGDVALGVRPANEVVKRWTILLDQNALGTDAPSNLPNGLTILATSPREAVIVKLGKLGAAARDALPVLKKELESKDKAVAAAAEKAIKLIEAAKDDTKTE